MPFHATFNISQNALVKLLEAGLSSLSLQQRAQAEIPLLGATLAELEAEIDLLSKEPVANLSSMTDKLQYYCMFIGYPRSGHSLIGSLLDAHEQMCIAHELNVLRLMDLRGLDRQQIFSFIIKNSQRFAEVGNQWGTYHYHVKDQFNGVSESLRVIGDKKGGASTQLLYDKPEILDQLYNTVQCPLKMVHIVRNPFDNIASIRAKDVASLEQAVTLYESLCVANQRINERMKDDNIIHIQHEDCIDNPSATMEKLVQFLGQNASPSYLQACEKVVNKSVSRSRDQLDWPPLVIEQVLRMIERYDFLQGYTFED